MSDSSADWWTRRVICADSVTISRSQATLRSRSVEVHSRRDDRGERHLIEAIRDEHRLGDADVVLAVAHRHHRADDAVHGGLEPAVIRCETDARPRLRIRDERHLIEGAQLVQEGLGGRQERPERPGADADLIDGNHDLPTLRRREIARVERLRLEAVGRHLLARGLDIDAHELGRHDASHLAVHFHHELRRSEVLDGAPLAIDDAHVHGDDVDAGSERRSLGRGLGRCCRCRGRRGRRPGTGWPVPWPPATGRAASAPRARPAPQPRTRSTKVAGAVSSRSFQARRSPRGGLRQAGSYTDRGQTTRPFSGNTSPAKSVGYHVSHEETHVDLSTRDDSRSAGARPGPPRRARRGRLESANRQEPERLRPRRHVGSEVRGCRQRLPCHGRSRGYLLEPLEYGHGQLHGQGHVHADEAQRSRELLRADLRGRQPGGRRPDRTPTSWSHRTAGSSFATGQAKPSRTCRWRHRTPPSSSRTHRAAR